MLNRINFIGMKYYFIGIFFVVFQVQSQDILTTKVEDFNELKVFNKVEVKLIKSDENRVEVSGIKRRDIVVKQIRGLLKISMRLDNIWDNSNTRVFVYYNNLNKIDANEGSKIFSEDTIIADKLDLRVQEGAEIQVKVDTDFLFGKSVTGSVINVYGNAKDQEVVVNTGGQYFADRVKSKTVKVKVSAGGTAEIQAEDYVKANTNAGGTIKIYGNPKEIDQQKLLGGNIIEVN